MAFLEKDDSFQLERMPVTPEVLLESSIPEVDPSAGEHEWNAATEWQEGQVVVRDRYCYERVTTGTSATPPESDEINWLRTVYSNRWRAFDNKVGTRSVQQAGQTLRMRFKFGVPIRGVSLFELLGARARVLVHDGPGEDAELLATRQWDLDGSEVFDWYSYFYAVQRQRRVALALDLPGEIYGAVITVEIEPHAGGQAGVGSLDLGQVHGIGSVELGAGAGIMSWGETVKDKFGNREYLPGEWANKVDGQLVARRSEMGRLHRLFARSLNVPHVWVFSQQEGLDPLILQGVITSFKWSPDNSQTTSTPFEIEGLNNNNDEV